MLILLFAILTQDRTLESCLPDDTDAVLRFRPVDALKRQFGFSTVILGRRPTGAFALIDAGADPDRVTKFLRGAAEREDQAKVEGIEVTSIKLKGSPSTVHFAVIGGCVVISDSLGIFAGIDKRRSGRAAAALGVLGAESDAAFWIDLSEPIKRVVGAKAKWSETVGWGLSVTSGERYVKSKVYLESPEGNLASRMLFGSEKRKLPDIVPKDAVAAAVSSFNFDAVRAALRADASSRAVFESLQGFVMKSFNFDIDKDGFQQMDRALAAYRLRGAKSAVAFRVKATAAKLRRSFRFGPVATETIGDWVIFGDRRAVAAAKGGSGSTFEDLAALVPEQSLAVAFLKTRVGGMVAFASAEKRGITANFILRLK